MPLADIQALFTSALSPDDSASQQTFLARHVRGGGTLGGGERLAVYRHTITASHVDTLMRIYPVCYAILGERMFSALAREFIWHCPSPASDLNLYGEQFPQFIEEETAALDSCRPFAYMGDLARLEWHWQAAFYRADDTRFDFEAFARLSGTADILVLQLSHSLRLMTSAFPIHEIWQRHRAGADTSSVSALQKPEYLCLFRDGCEPSIVSIGEPLWALLTALRQERTLGEIASHPKLRRSLDHLPALIGNGWITGFSIRPKDTLQAP